LAKSTKEGKPKFQILKPKFHKIGQSRLKNCGKTFLPILKSDLKSKPQKFLQYLVTLGIAKSICANGQRRFLTKTELKNNEGQILKNFSFHLKLPLENQENTTQQIK
jgi:hypothetical protein